MQDSRRKNNVLSISTKSVGIIVVLVIGFFLLQQSLWAPPAQAQTPNFDNANSSGQSGTLTASQRYAAAQARCAGQSQTDGPLSFVGGYPAYLASSYQNCINTANAAVLKQGVENSGTNAWSSLAELLSRVIYVFTVGLGSLVAYVAGSFLNLTIFISLNSTAYALDFLTNGWESVRNIANMGFIFILISIAITVMLKAETSSTLKALVRVIIIALIINFSFFGARLVIDAGNILAINFYNQIDVPGLTSNPGTDTTTSFTKNAVNVLTGSSGKAKDLTAPIMGAINVQAVLGTESFTQFAKGSGFFTTLISLSAIYISVGIIFGLLAAIFFTVGIKFITRVVILWIVIIAAPLAFLLGAFEGTKKHFHDWAEALVAYSVYPAVFLFMYLIIAKFAREIACPDPSNCSTSITASIFKSAAMDTTGSELGKILNIVVNIAVELGFIMLLLYIALKASDMISERGGRYAKMIAAKPDKLAAGLSGFARRATTILPTFVARNAPRAAGALLARPVGTLGMTLDKNLRSSRWANTEGIGGYLGTALRGNVAQPMSRATLLGSKTQVDVEKQRSTDKAEREKNLELGKDKTAVDTLAGTIATNIANKVNAELGLDKPALDRIQNMNESRMKEQSAANIKTLSNVFTESQMKVVEKLEKMSEQDKEIARKNFDENSPHSPLRKAKKQIDELRKINGTLTNLYRVTKVENTVGSVANPAHTTIDASVIDQMLNATDGVNSKLSRIDSDIAQQARAGADTFQLRQDKNLLQKAAKSLEKLADETKNIRAHVGGETDPAKFKS